jgi:hypothetical protein
VTDIATSWASLDANTAQYCTITLAVTKDRGLVTNGQIILQETENNPNLFPQEIYTKTSSSN